LAQVLHQVVEGELPFRGSRCWNPADPGQTIPAALQSVPLRSDLDQSDQGGAELMAEGRVGRGGSSDASIGFAGDQQQQGMAPVSQGIKPAATFRSLPRCIAAQTDQTLLSR
tara:strand:+ start:356 stop:691 length:336 start_codon:yes stop_codon:yes gene_type:complete